MCADFGYVYSKNKNEKNNDDMKLGPTASFVCMSFGDEMAQPFFLSLCLDLNGR